MIALKSQLVGAALVLAISSQKADAWGNRASYSSDTSCPSYSKLLPRNGEYRKHCEAETGPSGSDPKWPCFTFWNGELDEVTADTSQFGKAPDEFFLIKDGSKKDFTTRDPTKDFAIRWYGGVVEMTYSNFDKQKGCYDIKLKCTDNDLRIWVSAENSKERDIDTWKHEETSGTICGKWTHIHLKHDGQGHYW